MFRSIGKMAHGLSRSVPALARDGKLVSGAFLHPMSAGARHASLLTFTAHPTLHSDHLRDFGEYLSRQGVRPHSFLETQQLFRAFLADRHDPAEPPQPEDEWKLQLACLGMLMEHLHGEARAGRPFWNDVERPVTWIARDHDGTKVPPGSLVKQRCAEICFACQKYLALIDTDADPRLDEAGMLLQYTHDLAHELGQLASSGLSAAEIEARAARLLDELDLEQFEARLERLVPEGPLSALIQKFGLGGFEGEARINSDHLGTPRMDQVLDEIHAAKGLRAVNSIVIADCMSLKQFNVLRKALDERGLREVDAVPLLESRAAMEAHFAGEYRAVPRGQWVTPSKIMIAGSDNPRATGIALSILYAERAEIENAESGIASYRGTGWGPERSGGGSSAAAWSLVRGKDLEGRQWRAPAQLTVQGPPTALLLSPGSFQQFAGSFLGRAQAEYQLTRKDVAMVQQVLEPVIRAELENRAAESPFARAYKNSRLAQLHIPFAGSRDAVTKVKDGKQASANGPYENRAIKVNAMLSLACVQFGTGFGALSPDELQQMVGNINSVKASGDAGPKYLMDKVMFNLGMQAARLHEPAQLVELWKSCGFDAAAIESLDASARCVVALLERTGYSLHANSHLQKMVAQDWGVVHVPGDLQGNVDRIRSQGRDLHQATLKFLAGEGPFTRVEAAGPGPGRRSYSTLRGS